jgi:hypothetical protein
VAEAPLGSRLAATPSGAPLDVVLLGDNVAVMACPTCDRIARDEKLLRDAVQEHEALLRHALPEDVRAEVEEEEKLLAALLVKIEQARAA